MRRCCAERILLQARTADEASEKGGGSEVTKKRVVASLRFGGGVVPSLREGEWKRAPTEMEKKEKETRGKKKGGGGERTPRGGGGG